MSSRRGPGVFEFLLINHPLDCPVCDKGGECPLQDFSYTFGPDQSRMDFPRRIFDGDGVKGDVDFGPTLMLNRQRCILCTRCVRFMRDIDADAQINIIDRGYGSEIATFQEEGVHSLISGNLMDVCPVGAITTRDYRFKSRPWDNPNAADTICTQCEKGCNVTVWIKAKPEWAKGARLVRLTPRFNPDVNGYWMCDIGRFNYHWIEGDDRLRRPLARGAGRSAAAAAEPVSWHEAISKLRDRLAAAGAANPNGVRFLLSAHASHEELFLFRRLTEELLGPDGPQAISVAWRYQPKSQPAHTQFPVPPVDAPNVNGARIFGLVPGQVGDEVGEADISALKKAVAAGSVSALYVFDPGPDGSLGSVDWIIEARDAGDPPVTRRPGCPADRSRPRGRFCAAGCILRGEGSVLYERAGTAAGNRPGHSPARRCTGGLADSRERGHRARRAVRLHERSAGARRTSPRSTPGSGLEAHHGTQLQPAGAGTPLAAGVESVGAVEVGFHVSGSAAGEGRGRSDGSALAARCDSAQRSEVTHEAAPQQDYKGHGGSDSSELGLFLCVLGVLGGERVSRGDLRTRRLAARQPPR